MQSFKRNLQHWMHILEKKKNLKSILLIFYLRNLEKEQIKSKWAKVMKIRRKINKTENKKSVEKIVYVGGGGVGENQKLFLWKDQ